MHTLPLGTQRARSGRFTDPASDSCDCTSFHPCSSPCTWTAAYTGGAWIRCEPRCPFGGSGLATDCALDCIPPPAPAVYDATCAKKRPTTNNGAHFVLLRKDLQRRTLCLLVLQRLVGRAAQHGSRVILFFFLLGHASLKSMHVKNGSERDRGANLAP